MKKIILSIAYILVASSLFAQEDEQSQHELTINVGGGVSTFNYNLESGKSDLGLGGSLGLSYTFFINNQFGIGTGVEANFYRSKYSNEKLIGSYQGVDPDFSNSEKYFQLDYTYDEPYKEIQNALFVQVPLMFQFQTRGYQKFYVAAGGRIGFPVYTKFKTDLSALTVSGFYSHEGLRYANLPSKGFTNYDNTPEVDGKLSLKETAFMASLELGMKWALNDNFSLYTGIYGDYGLNDMQKTKDKGTVTYNHLGTISPKADPVNQDFLTFDNSITSTPTVEKIIPMTFGVKLRLSFGMGAKITSAKSRAIWIQQQAYYQAAAEEAYRRAEAARLKEVEDDVVVEEVEERLPVTNEELRILMEPIWGFDITKTVLTNEMKRILDRKIPILRKYWYLGIICEGHTCDIGTEQINDKLGYERAQSVKEYFVKNGLVSTRFSTVSRSKYQPAVRNDSEEHRKRNRRVELSIKK